MAVKIQHDAKSFRRTLTATVKNAEEKKVILHALAMYALSQSLKDGQNTPAADMLKELPNSINKRGLQSWFCAFGRIIISKGEVKHGHKDRAEKMDELLTLADSMPFWEYSTPKEDEVGVEFDFVKALVSQLAKAQTAKKLTADSSPILGEILKVLPDSVSEELQKAVASRIKKATA